MKLKGINCAGNRAFLALLMFGLLIFSYHLQIFRTTHLAFGLSDNGSSPFENHSSTAAGANSHPHVPGQLIIKFKAEVAEVEKARIINQAGGVTTGEIDQIALKVIKVPESAADQIQQALTKNDRVLYVEQDLLYEPEESATVNDPYFVNQWHLRDVGAVSAWSTAKGNNTVIAILDSGLESTHPDLAPKIATGGFNFYDNNSDWSDISCKHGTIVAGVAAAATNNMIGVASVSPNSKILPLRITDNNCWGSLAAISEAIVYASDYGAKIANLSFKIPEPSLAFADAYKYMYSHGGFVVVAAGNDGEYISAQDTPEVIHVGATDDRGYLASFSTYGPFIDFVAPGQGVYTAIWNGGYGYVSGTSFAAPIVSGSIALMYSEKPSSTPKEIFDTLKETAKDVVYRNSNSGIISIPVGQDSYSGWGKIDVSAALEKLNSSGDHISPIVTVPTDITVEATSPAGSTVSYSGYSASDNVGVVSGASCAPSSGSLFPLGATIVNCSAADAAGNIGTGSFLITVRDTTSPLLIVPNDILVQTSNAQGSYVSFSATASDLVYGTITPTCSSASGSLFPIGNSMVICTASDSSDNVASASFHVNVQFDQTRDNNPPQVSISPVSGTTVKGTTTISISATDDSGMKRVELYIDNLAKPKAIMSSAPFEYVWNTKGIKDGVHTITAIAYDLSGNKSSVSVSLLVSNGGNSVGSKPGR